MADVEVWGAEITGEKITSLRVSFKGTRERTIDRGTALAWLAAGHSLVVHSGAHHHPHRGASVERVNVDGAEYLRTDGKSVAADQVP